MLSCPQRLRPLLLLLIIINAHATLVRAQQQPPDAARLREIDEYAARTGRDWRVPGFAVAIVRGDRVVFAKGYGVRKLGDPAAVDERTLFAIASNTKAFTAAALATLVDEGKLAWDDPVVKHLPGFQLYDPYVTRELTVRDLLSHRSGLATFGGDLLWYHSTYTREELLHRVRFLKPASSFRSRFGYQNLLYLAAGQIIPAATGKSWDDYVRERILLPLGMHATTTTVRAFRPDANVAAPHNEADGKLRVLRHGNVDAVAPAGGLNSNVSEMAEWLRLQLGRGAHDGRRIFSAASSREMWTPHTVMPSSEQLERFNPTRHFNLYGLGWFLTDYQGRKLVSHGGGLDGMSSYVALVPEESLGLVVLTNSETPLASALAHRILDSFLGVAPRDWSADQMAWKKQGEEAAAAETRRREAARTTGTRPSLALASYAGSYTGDLYGEARVAEEGGRLVLRLVPSPDFVGDLEHWHHDTFRVKWREGLGYPFPRGFVTFTLDARGEIAEMKLDVPNPDFDFKELEFRRARPK